MIIQRTRVTAAELPWRVSSHQIRQTVPVFPSAPVTKGRLLLAAPPLEDPNFDRTKYDAIGESDRMTLKFRKPAAAPAAG